MNQDKNIFEIIFHARAGQGAKSAAEILAQAAMNEGKYIQAFPYYGPERSGAPTKTYVRISNKEIRTHEPIVDPDLSVVLDDTLLESTDVAKNITRNENLIINTKKSKEDITEVLGGFDGNLKIIDATDIAMKTVGLPASNSVILGKIIQVIGVVKLDSLKEEFRKIFEGKIGKKMTEKNILAIERGYDSL
ncbi:MAG: Pyruvate synthase subunit PorC [Candidatus Moranbacteria bacterium GW2011_GWE2_35_2-]|nr:MAG: Pyruvate synthase subunit PorC [Candidatus Moranbacteria bacterium GW2011_GWE2_35_2-]KKQ22964.1 MAG: Pyruvate synthase subunit PorC [Candidatus Moranbacteria bacterium GW2011_GWF2_37_11]KKQ29322.1 MAG: Pyruvate synthase subunit PorC [Candidatus Moranbacteria bacterium GW2011_GWD1_37_17]KKQ30805.1 MAG: Pyruvate synthase subunit PorC [Candidatus Moranbacteria bacterium GW2011_GWE1_37_24]KKQ47992.1 MAG: Pyruvate synthase subunit PorC [Candidatus Moranbacteria bacterium GW2011_GWD2_37_9]HB